MDLFLIFLILSALWLVHETAHVVVARCLGIRVRRMFLWMDAGFISLFQRRIKGTVYGLGWLPIGAYADIDLRGKPRRDALAVLWAGPAVDMAIAILAGVATALCPEHSGGPVLHYVRVAGVLALLSVARNLVPVGRTDGARITELDPRAASSLWSMAILAGAIALFGLFYRADAPLSFFGGNGLLSFAPWT